MFILKEGLAMFIKTAGGLKLYLRKIKP